jgi:hypothetical protein
MLIARLDILTAVTMKITVFLDVTPVWETTASSYFCLEDEGSMFFLNNGCDLPYYIMSHSKGQKSTWSLLIGM